MRIGQLVQIVETAAVNFDSENGAVVMEARDGENVLQILSFQQGKEVMARVYCPEQHVTFDVLARYLKANEFVDNEQALRLYEWPLRPMVTVSLLVKATDRQAVLPVLPEPKRLPPSDIDKLPYYQEAGASTPPAGHILECEDAVTDTRRVPYTRKRAALEAVAAIALATIFYLAIINFN